MFRITHPFHPLYGREFELLERRYAWNEDRVYFHDDNGALCGISASWTDEKAPDPFIVISAGRSAFRFEDLLGLAQLLACLRETEGREGCKVNNAGGVRIDTPGDIPCCAGCINNSHDGKAR